MQNKKLGRPVTKPNLPHGDHFYEGIWWRHFPSGKRRPLIDFVCGNCGSESRGPRGRTTYCSRKCSAQARAKRGDVKGAPASPPGTRYTRTDGYVFVAIRSDDRYWPMHTRKYKHAGWVQEHRLVMAKHLGRNLHTWESVHHVNGDRGDNRIENLQLRVGAHGKGQLACCGDCGSRNIVYEELP